MSETANVQVPLQALEGRLKSEPVRTVVSQLSARDHSRLGRTAVALERVFAFFISLALAEAARRSVGIFLTIPGAQAGPSSEPEIAGILVLLTFAALLATLIPFYHGGFDLIDQRARYYRCASTLDPKDMTRQRRLTFWNFVVLYVEGAILYAAAMSVSYPRLFTKCFLFLFLFDAIWVSFVFFLASIKEEDERRLVLDWVLYSSSAWVLVILAAVAFWRQPTNLAIAVSVILLVRTAIDYGRHVQDYFNPRPQVPEGLPEDEIVVRNV
jgi:hypothetical protein